MCLLEESYLLERLLHTLRLHVLCWRLLFPVTRYHLTPIAAIV
jgi:hypothetical protein